MSGNLLADLSRLIIMESRMSGSKYRKQLSVLYEQVVEKISDTVYDVDRGDWVARELCRRHCMSCR